MLTVRIRDVENLKCSFERFGSIPQLSWFRMPPQEGQILDLDPVAAILMAGAVMLIVGVVILCSARRWPWTVVAILGLVVAAGFAAVWIAAAAVVDHGTRAGWVWLRVGQLLVAIALPAWLLVAAARGWGSAAPQSRGVRFWVEALVAYGICCLVVAFLVGLFIHLSVAPSGEFR